MKLCCDEWLVYNSSAVGGGLMFPVNIMELSWRIGIPKAFSFSPNTVYNQITAWKHSWALYYTTEKECRTGARIVRQTQQKCNGWDFKARKETSTSIPVIPVIAVLHQGVQQERVLGAVILPSYRSILDASPHLSVILLVLTQDIMQQY